MSVDPVADRLYGRLVAFQRCAQGGAEDGWDHLPDLVTRLVRMARRDMSRDEIDDERHDFQVGWATAVMEVAQEVIRSFDALAQYVRAAVLAAEMEARS